MNGGDALVPLICHEYWQAIGRPNGKRESWLVGDERVAFADAAGMIRNYDLAGMNLANRRQAASIGPAGAEPRPEAVLQPRKLVEGLRVVDVSTIEKEQLSVYLYERVRCRSTARTSSPVCTGFERNPCIPWLMHRSR